MADFRSFLVDLWAKAKRAFGQSVADVEEQAEAGKEEPESAPYAQQEKTLIEEVMAANARYAERFGEKGNLALPPARRFAILTCMDARLDPAKYAGLSEGDAHVIRNAGGRATDDAIRSLVISYKLLGTQEWFVIHHTNCGMELFSDGVMANLLEDSLETASFDGKNWANPQHGGGSVDGQFIDWQTIGNQEESVVEDVRRIREHPLVPRNIPIYGYVYDVRTGLLNEVAGAMEAGRAV
jgi:carbonic anhydrase